MIQAKEKAGRIMTKYNAKVQKAFYTIGDFDEDRETKRKLVKELSLICVDEIIVSIFVKSQLEDIIYWEKVKTEIKKL